MEEDLKKLDALFDSILEEIIHPEKAGTFRNPFIEERGRRIEGLAESMIMITVKLTPDNMSAVCTVSAGSEKHKAFTVDDIKREATAAGVFYGINDDAINAMVSAQVVNMAIVIASGLPPINGIDGSLRMKVAITDDNGTSVDKDTEVCHIMMPKPGATVWMCAEEFCRRLRVRKPYSRSARGFISAATAYIPTAWAVSYCATENTAS